MSISLPGGQKHFGTESIVYSQLMRRVKPLVRLWLQQRYRTVLTAQSAKCSGSLQVTRKCAIQLSYDWRLFGIKEAKRSHQQKPERRQHEQQRNVAHELNYHVWGQVNSSTVQSSKFNTMGLRTTLCSWVLDIGLSHRQNPDGTDCRSHLLHSDNDHQSPSRAVCSAPPCSQCTPMTEIQDVSGVLKWCTDNNPLLTINRTKTLIIDFISHPIYISGAERYSCSHHLIKEHRSDQTTTNI